jgi:glycosyltransferase involved in cell wall biosynthesis
MRVNPKVLYLSPVQVQSGLGAAARGYFNCLSQVAEVSCIPIIDGHEAHPEINFPTKFDNDVYSEEQILIVHQNADAFDKILQNYGDIFNKKYKKKVAIWVWELENFQVQWLKYLKFLDELWVPSNFVKDAINKISNIPIRVVPHAIDTTIVSQTNFRKELNIPKEDFVIGFFFDSSSYVERKNPLALINVFNELSLKYPNIKLLLKISHIALFMQYLDYHKVKINKNVIFLNRNINQSEVYGLLKELDCYVSPHRTEGFGLTIAEAISVGTPVICTNYSGPTDFTSSDFCYPISFEKVNIEETMGPYEKGQPWAEIDKDELSKMIEKIIITDPQKPLKTIKGMEFIKKNYSTLAVSRKIKHIFENY